jgi:hypothetical protein
MLFTAEQKGHESISGLTYDVRLCNLGKQGMYFSPTVEQKLPKGIAGLKYKGSTEGESSLLN